MGVRADTSFVHDILNLFHQNWDLDLGHVHIPNVISKVLGKDADFETSNSNLAQVLQLRKQGQTVGQRILIYAFNTNDLAREALRNTAISFFKQTA